MNIEGFADYIKVLFLCGALLAIRYTGHGITHDSGYFFSQDRQKS